MSIYESLLSTSKTKGAGYFILIDPDKIASDKLPSFVEQATEAADTQLRLVVESLRVRGEQEMIAFESDLAKALVKGIRKPRVHLDAVGFVIISGRPRPVEG